MIFSHPTISLKDSVHFPIPTLPLYVQSLPGFKGQGKCQCKLQSLARAWAGVMRDQGANFSSNNCDFREIT